jgi:choline monooxygenase
VRYSAYVWDSGLRPTRADAAAASADLDRVEHEDDAVVEAVARGARSRLARRTGYAPGWEDGVRHFHAWLEG